MKKISKISASFLTVASIACIFWMGSYFLRMILTYQLFDETISSYKPYINENNISAILITINPAVISTFVLFIIFFVFYFLFLFSSGLNLRKNGWLFIITILILVTAPFEIYLMTIDYRIFTKVNEAVFRSADVIPLVKQRLKEISSFPLIELLSYCAIIFLAVFKPLTRED